MRIPGQARACERIRSKGRIVTASAIGSGTLRMRIEDTWITSVPSDLQLAASGRGIPPGRSSGVIVAYGRAGIVPEPRC